MSKCRVYVFNVSILLFLFKWNIAIEIGIVVINIMVSTSMNLDCGYIKFNIYHIKLACDTRLIVHSKVCSKALMHYGNWTGQIEWYHGQSFE